MPPVLHRLTIRRLLPAALIGLVSSFAFVAFFTSALHDPKPNELRVAVVGAPAATEQVQAGLDQALPGGFDLRRYDDEQDARDALQQQDVEGLFLPGPRRSELVVAGGAGINTSNALRTAFGAAAGARGQALRVTDAAPLPGHDSRGLSAFFLVAGTSVGSLVFAAVLFLLGGHDAPVPLRLRLALLAAFAAAAGLVVAVDTALVADGLGSSFWGVAAIGALLAATVASITTATVRWIGAPGIGLCFLGLMLFSLPASGGAVGPDFVPGFYREAAPVLPSHAALLALRGVVYFDGGGTTEPVLVLLAWLGVAVLALVAARLLGRRVPRLPALGHPLAERAAA